MFQIVYDIDYSGLRDLVDHIESMLRQPSMTAEAVKGSGDLAVQTWLDVSASKFKHSQGSYAQGIVEGIEYPFQGDSLHFKIIHKSTRAVLLEKGYEPFDMKIMLQTSNKIRISKKGKKYLIIPFEHGTPKSRGNPMPEDVYKHAKNLRHSVTTGYFKEGSIKGFKTTEDAKLLRMQTGNRVNRAGGYEWGDKLDIDYPLKRSEPQTFKIKNDKGDYVQVVSAPNKTNIYQGMVRFQNNPNIVRFNMGKFSSKTAGVNPTTNMRNYSSYITFRVMSEISQGWIHPGLKPMNILGETVELIKGRVLDTIKFGVKKDMETVFGKEMF